LGLQVTVVVALLAATVVPGPVGYAICAAVLLPAVLLMTVRWRGHTLLTWLSLGLGYRRRRRSTALVQGLDPATRMLDGATVSEVTDWGGRQFGVVQQATTWSSVCGLVPLEPGRLNGAGPARLPLSTLWSAVREDVRPAATMQIVVHRTVGLGGATRWRTWVSLGLDSRHLRDAVVGRGGGRLGMTRTLVVETSRVAVSAEAAGLLIQPLDAGQLQAAVREALGEPVVSVAGTDAADTLEENWNDCRVNDLAYRTYQQGGWTGSESLSAILQSREVTSATSITMSFLLARDERHVMQVRPLMRVAARVGRLTEVDREVCLLAERTRTSWKPLDGLQLLGLQATVPLGAGR
jgi:type VII secretion protein EccE